MQLLEHLLMQSHKRKTGSHFLAKHEQLYTSGPIRGLLKAQQITPFDVFIFWANIFRTSELSLVDLLENVDNKLDVISITACGYISRIILLYIIRIMEWKYSFNIGPNYLSAILQLHQQRALYTTVSALRSAGK